VQSDVLETMSVPARDEHNITWSGDEGLVTVEELQVAGQ
jgi:hypothetical protein